MSKHLVLHLERASELAILEIKLTPIAATKSLGKIKDYMKNGWKLVDVEGGNPAIREFIKRQIEAYDVDPKRYKVPIRETVKLGWKAGKGVGKPNVGLKEKIQILKYKAFHRKVKKDE